MSTIVRELLKNYYSTTDNERIDLNRAIDYLVKTEQIVGDDLIILKLTMEESPSDVIAKAVDSSKVTVYKRFIYVSGQIADYLGEDYQDTKIIRGVEEKLGRKLTEEEEKFCWKVIKRGRPLKDGLSILNFEEKDGKDTEDKTEGQVGM